MNLTKCAQENKNCMFIKIDGETKSYCEQFKRYTQFINIEMTL